MRPSGLEGSFTGVEELVKFQFWATVDGDDLDEVMAMDTAKFLDHLKKLSPHFLSVAEVSVEVLDRSQVEILKVDPFS